MNREFSVSKLKVFLVGLFMLMVLLILYLSAERFLNLSLIYRYNAIFLFAVAIIASIIVTASSWPMASYFTPLSIDNDGLTLSSKRINYKVKWNEIESINYKGFFIPLLSLLGTEAMYIDSINKHVICINWMRTQYLEAWKIVVDECRMQNPNIAIDYRILSRIQKP